MTLRERRCPESLRPTHLRVMAGLDPAINRGLVLEEMAGSSPAMT
jgi:hypothetical protein